MATRYQSLSSQLSRLSSVGRVICSVQRTRSAGSDRNAVTAGVPEAACGGVLPRVVDEVDAGPGVGADEVTGGDELAHVLGAVLSPPAMLRLRVSITTSFASSSAATSARASAWSAWRRVTGRGSQWTSGISQW